MKAIEIKYVVVIRAICGIFAQNGYQIIGK